MPTAIQRASNILDAIINGTATAAQKQRVADAFSLDPINQTATQKAQVLLSAIRHLILDRVKAVETGATVLSTTQTSNTAIDTDFTELP